MEKKKLCNGCNWPRTIYDQRKIKSLVPMIKKVRNDLIKEFGCRNDDLRIFAGNSFNDDNSVIARLESENQDEIKNVGWEPAIRAALVDCMSSDYYHTFEHRIDE